jgi:hypothetical protein
VVEDSQPRMTRCRDGKIDMRLCNTSPGDGIGSNAGQDIFVGRSIRLMLTGARWATRS